MFQMILTLSILLLFSSAHADQCASIEKSQAVKAMEVLSTANNINWLCEPCGEKSPRSIQVNSLEIKSIDQKNDWAVFLNGQNLDIAYTFVDGKNLAYIVQCPATGVSFEIK